MMLLMAMQFGTWVGKFQGLLGLDDVVPVLLEAAEFTLKDGQLAHGVVRSDLTLRQAGAKCVHEE